MANVITPKSFFPNPLGRWESEDPGENDRAKVTLHPSKNLATKSTQL